MTKAKERSRFYDPEIVKRIRGTWLLMPKECIRDGESLNDREVIIKILKGRRNQEKDEKLLEIIERRRMDGAQYIGGVPGACPHSGFYRYFERLEDRSNGLYRDLKNYLGGKHDIT